MGERGHLVKIRAVGEPALTCHHGHAGGSVWSTASPKAIEAAQTLLTLIWVEVAGPCKTVQCTLVRACSPNTLESTLPADW